MSQSSECSYTVTQAEYNKWGGNTKEWSNILELLELNSDTWDCPHKAIKNDRCIFHLQPKEVPSKLDEAEQLQQAIQRGNKSDNGAYRFKQFLGANFGTLNLDDASLGTFDGDGIVFIGSSFHTISLENTYLSEPTYFNLTELRSINFRNVNFNKSVYFSGAVFDGGACFECAHFGNEAVFIDANFRSNVLFDSAKFLGDADFADATFLRYMGHGEKSSFDNVEFIKSANFDSAEFDVVSFNKADFNRWVEFGEAQFATKASLRHAEFCWEETDLSEVNFVDSTLEVQTSAMSTLPERVSVIPTSQKQILKKRTLRSVTYEARLSRTLGFTKQCSLTFESM